MRKIDKTTILATVYKAWEEGIEQKGEKHPEYSSSNFKYYQDIVANLMYCQKGLCAYTEMLLIGEESYAPACFAAGRYRNGQNRATQWGIDLEHFDSGLKANRGWLWDNFFAIDKAVNVHKGAKPIDVCLKPDRTGYSPEKYLGYDTEKHIFFANLDLDDAEAGKVEKMIDVLGLNYDSIRDKRKAYLSEKREQAKSKMEVGVYQFFTAFAFCMADAAWSM